MFTLAGIKSMSARVTYIKIINTTMKATRNIMTAVKGLSLIALVITVLTLESCKDKTTPTASEIISKKLSTGAWKVKSVTVDNTDKTDLFKDFTLQYTATTYTTTHGTPVWPASGTWKFADEPATVITRDDGLEITIESIKDNEFIYSLTWTKTTYGAGRGSSVNGVHRFDMVR